MVRKQALGVLQQAGRFIPRSVRNVPLGGRVPMVRPAISANRLGAAVEGRVVVLTGGSSGIGLEAAHALAEAGAQLVVVARNEERLAELAAATGAHTIAADLSRADDADRVVSEVLEAHGGADVLVNNAAHSIRRPVDQSYDRIHDYERTMALNYFGPVRLTLGFLPGMRERHDGHIVNVSTMGTQIGPTPRFSAYLASKAALDQFSASLAQETVADGIAWSTVYMPLVRTPMIAPTKAYRKVPALSASEGAELLLEAVVDRPRYVSTPVGTIGHALHTVNPGAVETLVRVFTGTPARS